MESNNTICPRCGGDGKKYRKGEEYTHYLGMRNPISPDCPLCNGSGRISQEKYISILRQEGHIH